MTYHSSLLPHFEPIGSGRKELHAVREFSRLDPHRNRGSSFAEVEVAQARLDVASTGVRADELTPSVEVDGLLDLTPDDGRSVDDRDGKVPVRHPAVGHVKLIHGHVVTDRSA